MNKCLFCSKGIYGNYQLCKKHNKKKLKENQYSNLSEDIKNRICCHKVKSGKNKGYICGRISSDKNKMCSIHKRVENGVCYIPYCNRTAIKKGLMCKSHTWNSMPICICNRHHYPIRNITKTFTIPDDLLKYIFTFHSEKYILKCISKENWDNSIIPDKSNPISIPMQINIPLEALTYKISIMLTNLEKHNDIVKGGKICIDIYNLISKNLYLCKKYPKFKEVTLSKIREFEHLVPSLCGYYNIILEGVKLI